MAEPTTERSGSRSGGAKGNPTETANGQRSTAPRSAGRKSSGGSRSSDAQSSKRSQSSDGGGASSGARSGGGRGGGGGSRAASAAAAKAGGRSSRSGLRGSDSQRSGRTGSEIAPRSPADAQSKRAGARAGTVGASLDGMLNDAALGSQQQWLPGMAGVKAVAGLARRPQKVVRRGGRLAFEVAKIALGRSEVAPAKGDRRFKEPAWTGNPVFRRLGQLYLTTGQTVDGLLGDADLGWADERRVRFAAENVIDLLAPSNFPLTNPAVLKATLDTGGGNFVKGAGHLVRDMASKPRIPSMVDRSKFKVGKDLAVTPGEVVFRTDVFELLQYASTTAKVREHPVIVVPPMINKYYVTDLAPKRSMVEHLVASGQQTFAMSWRNPPDERFADWNLDTYAGAVIEALDSMEKITRSPRSQVLGLCAGGIVLSTVAAHLAATGRQDRLAGLTLAVAALDMERTGTVSAFVDRRVARLAVAESARQGYLDGRALAGVFAWLRPNDLIWNYWINNYLLGKDPPAFDVLFWNADTTNMPAALHRDFVKISLENALVKHRAATVLGTPVDLSEITVDSYLVAGVDDHIIPWQNAYRTTQLLGSQPRFVLSSSGHIAAMVNPPGNEKASFQTNTSSPKDAEDWLEGATQKRGTWWEDWVKWLSERSGEDKRAPRKLGNAAFPPLGPAPGTYVLNK